jgi:hypothetical protein
MAALHAHPDSGEVRHKGFIALNHLVHNHPANRVAAEKAGAVRLAKEGLPLDERSLRPLLYELSVPAERLFGTQ